MLTSPQDLRDVHLRTASRKLGYHSAYMTKVQMSTETGIGLSLSAGHDHFYSN